MMTTNHLIHTAFARLNGKMKSSTSAAISVQIGFMEIVSGLQTPLEFFFLN